MVGSGPDDDTDNADDTADDTAQPGWSRPLGSPDMVDRLQELVIKEAVDRFGSGFTVDIDRGVVIAPDRSWRAALGPLATVLAACHPEAWPLVIEREAKRWQQAVDNADSAPGRLAIRLTTPTAALGGPIRPALESVSWELVHDHSGELTAATGRIAEIARRDDAIWEQVAQATVDRCRPSWARLDLPDKQGFVLSGPSVSASLYGRRRRLAQYWWPGRAGRQTMVFSNSLLLVVTDGPPELGDSVSAVVASLRLFASDRPRGFPPFVVVHPAD